MAQDGRLRQRADRQPPHGGKQRQRGERDRWCRHAGHRTGRRAVPHRRHHGRPPRRRRPRRRGVSGGASRPGRGGRRRAGGRQPRSRCRAVPSRAGRAGWADGAARSRAAACRERWCSVSKTSRSSSVSVSGAVGPRTPPAPGGARHARGRVPAASLGHRGRSSSGPAVAEPSRRHARAAPNR